MEDLQSIAHGLLWLSAAVFIVLTVADHDKS